VRQSCRGRENGLFLALSVLAVQNSSSSQNTNPHSQLIHYNALLSYGRRDTNFFRSRERWQTLIPLLMDHVLVEIDPDIQDTYSGLGSSMINVGGFSVPVPVPIEAKLRTLAVRLLYEVCRVRKWTTQDLREYYHPRTTFI
jgi:hypothetical protein